MKIENKLAAAGSNQDQDKNKSVNESQGLNQCHRKKQMTKRKNIT